MLQVRGRPRLGDIQWCTLTARTAQVTGLVVMTLGCILVGLANQSDAVDEPFPEDPLPGIMPAIFSAYMEHRNFDSYNGFHTGIDISSPPGTSIRMPADGSATLMGWEGFHEDVNGEDNGADPGDDSRLVFRHNSTRLNQLKAWFLVEHVDSPGAGILYIGAQFTGGDLIAKTRPAGGKSLHVSIYATDEGTLESWHTLNPEKYAFSEAGWIGGQGSPNFGPSTGCDQVDDAEGIVLCERANGFLSYVIDAYDPVFVNNTAVVYTSVYGVQAWSNLGELATWRMDAIDVPERTSSDIYDATSVAISAAGTNIPNGLRYRLTGLDPGPDLNNFEVVVWDVKGNVRSVPSVSTADEAPIVSAACSGGVVTVQWTSAREEGTIRYLVEKRTTAGSSFLPVGEVRNDRPFSGSIWTWSEELREGAREWAEYRVVALNGAGGRIVSDTKRIEGCSRRGRLFVGAFPNPGPLEGMTVNLAGGTGENAVLKLYDVTGRLVYSEEVPTWEPNIGIAIQPGWTRASAEVY